MFTLFAVFPSFPSIRILFLTRYRVEQEQQTKYSSTWYKFPASSLQRQEALQECTPFYFRYYQYKYNKTATNTLYSILLLQVP